jgi:hypothetical protein
MEVTEKRKPRSKELARARFMGGVLERMRWVALFCAVIITVVETDYKPVK